MTPCLSLPKPARPQERGHPSPPRPRIGRAAPGMPPRADPATGRGSSCRTRSVRRRRSRGPGRATHVVSIGIPRRKAGQGHAPIISQVCASSHRHPCRRARPHTIDEDHRSAPGHETRSRLLVTRRPRFRARPRAVLLRGGHRGHPREPDRARQRHAGQRDHGGPPGCAQRRRAHPLQRRPRARHDRR